MVGSPDPTATPPAGNVKPQFSFRFQLGSLLGSPDPRYGTRVTPDTATKKKDEL